MFVSIIAWFDEIRGGAAIKAREYNSLVMPGHFGVGSNPSEGHMSAFANLPISRKLMAAFAASGTHSDGTANSIVTWLPRLRSSMSP